MLTRLKRGVLWWLVLVLYLVAFLLPSFGDGNNAPIGAVAFFWAPLGALFILLTGGRQGNPGLALILFLTWLANPVLWLGVWWLAKQSWQSAAWAGTLAGVLGSAIAVYMSLTSTGGKMPPRRAPPITVVNPDVSRAVVPTKGAPDAAAPVPPRANSFFRIGYYAWLLSMIVLAAIGWIAAYSAGPRRVN